MHFDLDRLLKPKYYQAVRKARDIWNQRWSGEWRVEYYVVYGDSTPHPNGESIKSFPRPHNMFPILKQRRIRQAIQVMPVPSMLYTYK